MKSILEKLYYGEIILCSLLSLNTKCYIIAHIERKVKAVI